MTRHDKRMTPAEARVPAAKDLPSLSISTLHPVNFWDGTSHRLTQNDWNRISKKIKEAPDGCWNWIGHLTAGYGRIRIGQRFASSHRVTYMALIGPIPTGLQLDHLCRNPPCCNPMHLEPVTSRENSLRAPGSITAINVNKVTCEYGHPLEAENLLADRNGKRRCKACGLRASRIHRAEKLGKPYDEDGYILPEAKGNFSWRGRTTCVRGHVLNEANIYVNPQGWRSCRQCKRDNWRRNAQKKQAS